MTVPSVDFFIFSFSASSHVLPPIPSSHLPLMNLPPESLEQSTFFRFFGALPNLKLSYLNEMSWKDPRLL